MMLARLVIPLLEPRARSLTIPVWGYWMVGLSSRYLRSVEWAAAATGGALAASSVVLALLVSPDHHWARRGQRAIAGERAWLAAAVWPSILVGWVGAAAR